MENHPRPRQAAELIVQDLLMLLHGKPVVMLGTNAFLLHFYTQLSKEIMYSNVNDMMGGGGGRETIGLSEKDKRKTVDGAVDGMDGEVERGWTANEIQRREER